MDIILFNSKLNLSCSFALKFNNKSLHNTCSLISSLYSIVAFILYKSSNSSFASSLLKLDSMFIWVSLLNLLSIKSGKYESKYEIFFNSEEFTLKTLSDMEDKTLYELVTEAFPIVVFVKRLEDNSRKIMEIKECIIHEDGRREKQTLFKYEITSSKKIDGKTKITGEFKKVNNISDQLQQRLNGNGIPTNDLKKLVR